MIDNIIKKIPPTDKSGDDLEKITVKVFLSPTDEKKNIKYVFIPCSVECGKHFPTYSHSLLGAPVKSAAAAVLFVPTITDEFLAIVSSHIIIVFRVASAKYDHSEVKYFLPKCCAKIAIQLFEIPFVIKIAVENRIRKLEKENTEIKQRIELLDRNSRRNNIVVFGLMESEEGSLVENVGIQLNSKLGVELTKTDISNTYPLPNPSYQFGFDVKDDLYTNYQNRKEQREGNKITGSYSVVDSDGFIRTVSYTADPKEGFKAELT
uniref:Cuticular protein 46 n=1 Tax=Leptinotarsa decemlineata TaxID=7539 RepID=A0A3Q8HG50_LEPDE|nr:cuticular protein 46 [Leptinotarsa decemlineata]